MLTIVRFRVIIGKIKNKIKSELDNIAAAYPVKHFSFVSFAGKKTVNFDLFLLSDSVASSLSLKIVLRIPVGVKDDNCVRGG